MDESNGPRHGSGGSSFQVSPVIVRTITSGVIALATALTTASADGIITQDELIAVLSTTVLAALGIQYKK